MRIIMSAIVCVMIVSNGFGATDDGSPEALPSTGEAVVFNLPREWLQGWNQPPLADRPLQIIHGIAPNSLAKSGMDQMVAGAKSGNVAPQGMALYKNLGLGGVVCNVDFKDYMRSEEKWKTLVRGVEECKKLGMVVWIYDEEGYPSGAAGGLVLEENSEYEAQALVFDSSLPDPFLFRPAYEHTHASNNFYAARRYVNIIDDRAVRTFIEKTHKAYRNRLGPLFASSVEAFFTDEPSLITVNLGQIGEEVRKNVRVADPLNPAVKPLPSVPWVYDLPERYRERFGEDILKKRRSLFEGDAKADRKTRRQYWALISDLVADRYFGAIQEWCARAGVASSGHSLWEEMLLNHSALEGNGLKALSRMDIPGLDLLSSNPESVIHSGWMTAALPASSAILTGQRRVMTEVSDFSEKMAKQGPASLDKMQATAAWQAAWGVTDFTLYYAIADRSAADYRAYCDYVGRLNAILKPARLNPDVLLYYPIYDLWGEYRPVAEKIEGENQSPRSRKIVGSFMRLGQALTRGQMPFSLIDHEFLSKAIVRSDGRLEIKGHFFRSLIIPEGIELPPGTADVVERFKKQGGRVLRDSVPERLTTTAVTKALRPEYRLDTPSERIILGRFARDGRTIVLLLNVGKKLWKGQIHVPVSGLWSRLDPATGGVETTSTDNSKRIGLTLNPRQCLLLISK